MDTSARDQFEADTHRYEPTPDMKALYDEKAPLVAIANDLSADIAKLTRREATASKRGNTVAYDKAHAELDETIRRHDGMMTVIKAVDAKIDAIRMEKDTARRAIIDAAMRSIMEDFGNVVDTTDGRPNYVVFTPSGPMASGETFAILARGDYAFEVGVKATEPGRFFVFGYDVDVHGPDSGYASTDGTIQGRHAATVAWGSIGAQPVPDARTFASLIGYAADIAAAVNAYVGVDARTDRRS